MYTDKPQIKLIQLIYIISKETNRSLQRIRICLNRKENIGWHDIERTIKIYIFKLVHKHFQWCCCIVIPSVPCKIQTFVEMAPLNLWSLECYHWEQVRCLGWWLVYLKTRRKNEYFGCWLFIYRWWQALWSLD